MNFSKKNHNFPKKTLLLACVSLLFIQCEAPTKKEKTTGLISQKAMVVSAREEASQIGSDILKKGGNAFDAMVATQLALAVVYPVAGNIGGGGFMVYRTNEGKTGALDYREKAPLASSKDMYLDKEGNMIKQKSTLGAMAVGVPGAIAGIFEVYEKFGSLPIAELIQPSIDLARKGINVTKKQARSLNRAREKFALAKNYTILLDKEWKEGDRLKFEELAQALERIRDHGKDGFYKGETATQLVDFLNE